jgi:predicted transcriptional regulator of viral defense system
LAARPKEAGLADQVEKGQYLLLGLEPALVLSNPLCIANQLVDPCYIGYWSALHFHGFTTQTPHTVFCATSRKKNPVTYRDQTYRYVLVKPHKFFGYQRERIGGLPVLVADEAKTIMDSLDQPRYAGGLSEVGQALNTALPNLEVELLVDYAVRMADKSLASRLGDLLEQLGRPAPGLPVSQSPVALDPEQPRQGVHSARWHVVVNVPADRLLPQGIG